MFIGEGHGRVITIAISLFLSMLKYLFFTINFILTTYQDEALDVPDLLCEFKSNVFNDGVIFTLMTPFNLFVTSRRHYLSPTHQGTL